MDEISPFSKDLSSQLIDQDLKTQRMCFKHFLISQGKGLKLKILKKKITRCSWEIKDTRFCISWRGRRKSEQSKSIFFGRSIEN